jgi:hemolysin D
MSKKPVFNPFKFNPLGLIGLAKDSYQFRPGLAEIEEKPLSPLGPFIVWSIVAILAFLTVWMTLGEVDVVVSARGKVVPKGQLKVVQSLDSGVLKKLYVEPGQWVMAGDPIAELEPDTLEPNYLAAQQTLAYAQQEQARLNSQLTGGAPEGGLSSTQTVLRERAIAQIQAKLNAKQQEWQQIMTEQQSTQDEARETKTLLASAKARQAQLAPVADLVAKQELDEAEDKITELRTRVQTLNHKWDELQARERQVKRETQAIQAETQAQWLTDLSQREKTVLELNARQRELGFRRQKMVITAPVSGMVNQRFVNTLGGVVKSAEPLVTIVPKDTPLQIEVQMDTKESGYVKKDMAAKIKLDTFEYTKYGTLPARVIQVGADTVQAKTNQPEHYPIWIQPKQTWIKVKGKQEALKPGMTVTADITTGKRKIIEFILYPVMGALQETASLR